MRIVIGIMCAVLLVGCAKTKVAEKSTGPVVQPGKPVVTPDYRTTGKVISVNSEAKFVILNFPITNIPQPGRRLNVYHDGLKVGEVKITGPERDGNIVADLVVGQAQVRDEAREE
jgi:hypothetical protein